MNVLLACEESQTVCKAFRKRGHKAFSCDIEPCSGGHPEWHIHGDVLDYLDLKKCNGYFHTEDGQDHEIYEDWDMIIAFPPCTDLAVSGARYFERKRKSGIQQKSIEFFMAMVESDCEKIAVENPVGIMSTHCRKPDQIVQPYFFGDPHKKTTCLWLKGLPPLEKTNMVDVEDLKTYNYSNGEKKVYSEFVHPKDENGKYLKFTDKEVKKIRSKTFPGIAEAMANQWG